MNIAISIGNFDAVHLGHKALIRTARDAVGEEGRVEMWSFDPAPITVLRPSIHVDRLTTFEQRRDLLLAAGADVVKRLEPTPELLAQTPETFLTQIVEESNPTYIVEGEGFRFGKERAGSSSTLDFFGQKLGFTSLVIPSIEVVLRDQLVVSASSSMVRWLLHAGRVEDAAIMLGRPVQLSGKIQQGDRVGRTMGIPTANMQCVETMLPRDGVYAGVAYMGDELHYIAAISIGTKPTFGKHDRVCEVHLIGYDGEVDHYDWSLTVTLSHWIRDQLRFDSKDDLRRAIQSDIETTQTLIESNQ